jgi:hypothetical protein
MTAHFLESIIFRSTEFGHLDMVSHDGNFFGVHCAWHHSGIFRDDLNTVKNVPCAIADQSNDKFSFGNPMTVKCTTLNDDFWYVS